MARYQTADGRWMVGDVEGQSNYNGFNGWRDCVIQLTASGATAQSVKYLEAFRDYALAYNALGESIMPPSVNVWISNNGTTTAVQADDLSVSGNTFTIGGIKWTGSAWDYTNAGQSSGGGGSGGGGATIVHAALDAHANGSLDMTAGEILAAAQTGPVILVESAEGFGIIGAGCCHYELNEDGSQHLIKGGAIPFYSAASLDDYPSIGGSSDGDNPGAT